MHYQEFCERYFGTRTQSAESRCTAAEKLLDEYKTIAFHDGPWHSNCMDRLKGEESGRIVIRTEEAERCLARVAAIVRDRSVRRELPRPIEVEECALVLSGTVADGQRCDYAEECALGHTCPTIPPVQANDPHQVCRPAAANGEPCYYDGVFAGHPACADGACVAGRYVCARMKNLGEACTVDDTCVEPLRCQAGTCAPLGTLGSACSGDVLCEEPLSCDKTSHLCQKRNFGEPGDPCGYNIPHCRGVCDDERRKCIPFCGSN
jgi:hypothetical protein